MDLEKDKELKRERDSAKARYTLYKRFDLVTRTIPIAVILLILFVSVNAGWAKTICIISAFYIFGGLVAFVSLHMYTSDYGKYKTAFENAKYDYEDAEAAYSEFMIKGEK